MRPTRPFADRFFEKVIPEPMSGCWLWMGASSGFGYGSLGVGRASEGTIMAHVASALIHGLLTERHAGWVLHHCDNPPCVNPRHLFIGTQLDNLRDMARKGRNRVAHPEVRGEKQWNARLTADLVRTIRVRASAGEKHETIARDMGVCRSNISIIVRRKSWGHVQ